jgi:hypothetical protein
MGDDLVRAESLRDAERHGAQEVLLEGAEPAGARRELDLAVGGEARELRTIEVGGQPDRTDEDRNGRCTDLRRCDVVDAEHEMPDLGTPTETGRPDDEQADQADRPERAGEPASEQAISPSRIHD